MAVMTILVVRRRRNGRRGGRGGRGGGCRRRVSGSCRRYGSGSGWTRSSSGGCRRGCSNRLRGCRWRVCQAFDAQRLCSLFGVRVKRLTLRPWRRYAVQVFHRSSTRTTRVIRRLSFQLGEPLLRVRPDLHSRFRSDVLLDATPSTPVLAQSLLEAVVFLVGPPFSLFRYRVRLSYFQWPVRLLG